MSLEKKIMDNMKDAMRAKNTVALEALRAIKAAIIIAKTDSGAAEGLTEEDEIKMLQRLVKMRKDSATIFTEQNRMDLAEPELAQIAVIEQFLPAQLSEALTEAIEATGTSAAQLTVVFVGVPVITGAVWSSTVMV